MTRQLVDKYESELSSVREQLAQTNVLVRFHQSQQNMLEEVGNPIPKHLFVLTIYMCDII
jgi:hypothetical protein